MNIFACFVRSSRSIGACMCLLVLLLPSWFRVLQNTRWMYFFIIIMNAMRFNVVVYYNIFVLTRESIKTILIEILTVCHQCKQSVIFGLYWRIYLSFEDVDLKVEFRKVSMHTSQHCNIVKIPTHIRIYCSIHSIVS